MTRGGDTVRVTISIGNTIDDIELEYCAGHERWYVGECPDCMADTVNDDKDEAIKELRETIGELEDKIADLEADEEDNSNIDPEDYREDR